MPKNQKTLLQLPRWFQFVLNSRRPQWKRMSPRANLARCLQPYRVQPPVYSVAKTGKIGTETSTTVVQWLRCAY